MAVRPCRITAVGLASVAAMLVPMAQVIVGASLWLIWLAMLGFQLGAASVLIPTQATMTLAVDLDLVFSRLAVCSRSGSGAERARTCRQQGGPGPKRSAQCPRTRAPCCSAAVLRPCGFCTGHP
jgi:hypothetical protein